MNDERLRPAGQSSPEDFILPLRRLYFPSALRKIGCEVGQHPVPNSCPVFHIRLFLLIFLRMPVILALRIFAPTVPHKRSTKRAALDFISAISNSHVCHACFLLSTDVAVRGYRHDGLCVSVLVFVDFLDAVVCIFDRIDMLPAASGLSSLCFGLFFLLELLQSVVFI